MPNAVSPKRQLRAFILAIQRPTSVSQKQTLRLRSHRMRHALVLTAAAVADQMGSAVTEDRLQQYVT